MGPNFRVLIAEDDDDYGLLVQAALQASGWTSPVHRVSDGAAAIAYLKGEGPYENRTTYPLPCAVFLDVKMPGTTGLDVLQWIKEHPASGVFPALILTSSDEQRDIQRAYALGAHGYFIKPPNYADLKSMLHSAHEFSACCAKPAPRPAPL